ncbi:Ap2-like ethylene-responsive transcription factor snz [Thalictrum thalictroides]|uniref:Ap2-like ethylene-responsive transcription factor snz n=1 Tax=Thalictrum thalictroides TaxID=46969 RepID=A0A7J6VSJ6_THATH|nr:Ap2-like ethylene-responsive transcription factor snz [Thalictrum thalictroides]
MEPIPQNPPLADLITALENATLIAKQIPTTSDSTQFFQLCSSLQNVNNQLTSFLNQIPSSQPPQTGEDSFNSAVGGDEDEIMQIRDDDDYDRLAKEEEEEGESSKIIIDGVEERLRNCYIQNKRRKRPLSPTSAAVEQRGLYVYGNGVVVHGFDPHVTRLKSFDLVFQFHG